MGLWFVSKLWKFCGKSKFGHNRNTTGYAPIAVRTSKVEITDTVGATHTLLPYLNPGGILGLYDEKRKVWYMDTRGGNAFGYEG